MTIQVKRSTFAGREGGGVTLWLTFHHGYICCLVVISWHKSHYVNIVQSPKELGEHSAILEFH